LKVPEFKACFESFIQYFDDCPIDSIQKIIDYNQEVSQISDQNFLLKGLGTTAEPEDQKAAIAEARRLGGADGLDKIFEKYAIDIAVAPGDGPFCIWAAAAGYPVAVAPLDVLDYNGRPFGICFIARAREENLLLTFMRAWESISGARPLPLPLVEVEA
jgi:amidase